MSTACQILYCHCAYARVVPPPVKAEVLARLTGADVPFDAVPDLCEMSARRDPRLAELVRRAAGANGASGEHAASGENGAPGQSGGAAAPLVIAACYPRAVRWLFSAAGAPLPDNGTVTVLNMRTETAETIVNALLDPAAASATPAAADPAGDAAPAAVVLAAAAAAPDRGGDA